MNKILSKNNKIMYVLNTSHMTGSTISFKNMIDELLKKNIRPIVIFPKSEKTNIDLLNYLRDRKCICYRCYISSAFLLPDEKRIKKIIRYFYNYYRIIKGVINLSVIVFREKPIIIHSNSSVVQEGYRVSKIFNIKHIWHIREYQDKDFNFQFFPSEKKVKKFLKDSNTICITKDIQKHFDLRNNDNSKVIYNPIFHKDIMHGKENNSRENYFLIANRISPEKGIEDIIRAFKIFCESNDNYELVVIGEANEEYLNEIKKMCEKMNIEKRIKFLGFQKDVKPYMQNAKGLIVASFNEGFGRMTAEANMIGCPVIGRNSGGTKEIIDETRGGFLFNNINELAEDMEKICKMNDTDIIKFMEEPMRKANNLYSIEQSGENVFAFYNRILNQ